MEAGKSSSPSSSSATRLASVVAAHRNTSISIVDDVPKHDSLLSVANTSAARPPTVSSNSASSSFKALIRNSTEGGTVPSSRRGPSLAAEFGSTRAMRGPRGVCTAQHDERPRGDEQMFRSFGPRACSRLAPTRRGALRGAKRHIGYCDRIKGPGAGAGERSLGGC